MYVVATRSGSLVVVTSGAVQRLTGAELAAVIAHEHAHAAGRHHLLITALGLLAETFPASRLFTQAHTHVTGLVEVCADDAAIRHHGRLDLARALVTVAEGLASSGSRAPAGALAASGGDAAGRVHRLLTPPEPPRAWIRWVVAAVVIALPVMPLAVAALAPWSATLAGCPPLFR